MAKGRTWAGQAASYGAAGESGVWKVAYDHYYWDRLKEAYDAASTLGAGQAAYGLVGFRMIEGEYSTRERGETAKISDWLSVEAIVSELPEAVSVLSSRIVEGCNQVAWRFGFDHGPPVLVTVMAEDANVPWMPGRHGYCTDKYPYDKICIPNFSTRDFDDLEHVVMHEYAHVVNLNLSEGRCPLWLDEAVAMVAGGGVDQSAWRMLADGRATWLDPDALGRTYLLDREDSGGHRLVWLAYQQSAVLGYYLCRLKGERALGDLMRAFANNTTLQDLLMRFKGEAPSDEALKEVYGISTRELFERAHSWLVSGARD